MNKVWKTVLAGVGVVAVATTLLVGRQLLMGDSANDSDRINISFFGWGNESEVSLTQQFVEEFNNSQDKIFVKYTSIPNNDYGIKITNSLYSKTPPDILLAGDGEIKPWIELGGLASLDEFLDNSTEIDLDDFWEEGQNRYYYNPQTRLNGNYKDPSYKSKGYHHYGIMRDLSPTVLFYNKTAFEKVGVEVVSLSPEKQMEQYGYARGFNPETLVFNNKIPMTYEEMLKLAALNNRNPSASAQYRNEKATTTYGIHYVNWFSLGWSVNANSLQWLRDDSYSLGGYYQFTLGDPQANYSVKEGKSITIGQGIRETTYTEGQLVQFDNLPDVRALGQELIDEYFYTLPSALQATQDYVDLSAKYKVGPKPDFTNSSSVSQYSIFTSGNQTAMIADSRYAVGIYRNLIKNKFEWDCAPLPTYEHGVQSGHSGSLAFCISEKSKHKAEAFEFIEYINGKMGQTAFAEAGFTIPNTKSLSNSNAFLQKAKSPANSQIFVQAAGYQTVGDWGFLPSKDWITPWSTLLNSKVLNGDMELSDALNQTEAETQRRIEDYYKNINFKK